MRRMNDESVEELLGQPIENVLARLDTSESGLSSQEAEEYLKEISLSETGLSKVIKKAYQILDLITFFTTQNNILQAWTVSQNTKAPQAAGRIHTDFEEGFIKAEVINWQDLVKSGSETNARDQGLYGQKEKIIQSKTEM